MADPKFNVGDRIVVNKKCTSPRLLGKVGTILKVCPNYNKVVFWYDIDLDGYGKTTLRESRLDPETKTHIFKAGDRIKVATEPTLDRKLWNRLGTIASISKHVGRWYFVTLDGETFDMALQEHQLVAIGSGRAIDQIKINIEVADVTVANPMPVTLKEAMQLEMDHRMPKYVGTPLEWYKEGRCPHCGELGRYHLSAPVCSTHGPY